MRGHPGGRTRAPRRRRLGRSLRRRRWRPSCPTSASLRAALAPDAWAALAPQLGRAGAGARGRRHERAPQARHADARQPAAVPRVPAARFGARPAADARRGRRFRRRRGRHARAREPRREPRRDAPMLRDVLARALAPAARTTTRWRARTTRGRRPAAGRARCPPGCSARRSARRHLALLQPGARAWTRSRATGPPALAPIWLGAAPEHRRDVDLAPALPLSVPRRRAPRRWRSAG